MKDLGEASYVLEIWIFLDRKNKMLALSQASYIEKILENYCMEDSKKGQQLMRHEIALFKEMSPKTSEEVDSMRKIPYASAVGSLIYAMLCMIPNICYVVGIVSRYQSNSGQKH